MSISKKSWAIVGGTAAAFALAPLAAVSMPSVLDQTLNSGGVVVAAANPGPVDEPTAASAPGVDGPQVVSASPDTPSSAVDSPATPQTATSPKSAVSAKSPVSPKSPDTPD